MGIAYQCDPNLRCTFVVWDGDVTPEQWSDQADRIIVDPAFPPGPLVLADLSTAGGAPSITTTAIEEIAQRWRERLANLGGMQWAFIPNGAWEKARQFEFGLEGSKVRTMVFNETSVACTWLGIDARDARQILRELREGLRNT